MCGIAGLLSANDRVEREEVAPMIDALAHRGPDGSGLWSDGICALGHRRLRILDVTENGRQPMADEAGKIWISFNGEIYNFQALRAELTRLGHRFHTGTDTEVLIHAYREWDLACLDRLRGMFAFGLWDCERRRLLLARDRVGKKPLFYTRVGDRFLFASELQGLLAHPIVPRRVHHRALDQYLTWGYVPAPMSAFDGIGKLPPAHYLTISPCSGAQAGAGGDPLAPTIARYWRLNYRPTVAVSCDEAAAMVRTELTEAVRLRMIADVPVGASLSGGIDSSIVVGLMAGLSSRPIQTFSIGFEEAAYNELGHARRIADRWGTDHQELIVKPDAAELAPKLVRHFGEPFADSSAIPSYYLAQLARGRVRVLLNGDGGDESFAGYSRYLANQAAEWIRRIPGSGAVSRLLRAGLPNPVDERNPLRRLKRFLSVAALPMRDRYPGWLTFFSREDKRALYTPSFAAACQSPGDTDWFEACLETVAQGGASDPIEWAMALDVESYLPYDLLVKVSITSMANSLEARSPFLDHRLMAAAASLPTTLKVRGLQPKYLLARTFADLLPPENVYRRKMGFGVPVGDWMRGPLKAWLQELLMADESRRRGFFHPPAVRRLVDEHLDRRADHGFKLWNLCMFELWHREFRPS